MVRPAVIPRWERLVYRALAANSRLSARQLREVLVRSYPGAEVPSERTIGRIKKSWDELPEDRKRLLQEVQWPQSMGTELLPWDASPAILELLGEYGTWMGVRPEIGLASWFWRITQAAPDLPLNSRIAAARTLWAWEILGRPETSQIGELEEYLVYAPWRAPENKLAYQQAIRTDDVERTRSPDYGIDDVDEWWPVAAFFEGTPDSLVERAFSVLYPDSSEENTKLVLNFMKEHGLTAPRNSPGRQITIKPAGEEDDGTQA